MIKKPYREYHLFNLLNAYDTQRLPLDLFISNYFRDNKALGSKDRAFIAETTYAMIRWLGLLDYLCPQPADWEKRFELFKKADFKEYLNDETIPLHVRLSFPKCLFDLIVKSHGEDKALELCRVSNKPAPTTVRVNVLKTTREALLQRWKGRFQISPCAYAKNGIIFHEKTHFFSLPEFKEGMFEVQDEGSQLLSELMQIAPGQQVMDYCAGSGGKTLAFAPLLQGSGQIFVHDVRPHALLEARKRLKRAGIQNAQAVHADDPKLKKLKKRMDWILVDAPCSGTGTMRRNPDMKWNFTEEMLTRLVGQQRMIFEKALSFLKPGGHIVYATCSILNDENQDQLAHFLKTYDLQLVQDPFNSLPVDGGMDGFFGAVLKRKDEG
jgi:16S rRNA (cytosine967-C5)-methyltransferase